MKLCGSRKQQQQSRRKNANIQIAVRVKVIKNKTLQNLLAPIVKEKQQQNTFLFFFLFFCVHSMHCILHSENETQTVFTHFQAIILVAHIHNRHLSQLILLCIFVCFFLYCACQHTRHVLMYKVV